MSEPNLKSTICLCGSSSWTMSHHYELKPEGEISFGFLSSNYSRYIYKCNSCGHFISKHEMNMDNMYAEEYVSSNYTDETGIKKTFDKINNLPIEKSDNIGRVNSVNTFAQKYFGNKNSKSILDIGSGLCVFLYQMKKQGGWDCTALDPDARTVEHAIKNAGVKAIQADFLKLSTDVGKFDTITFNKVLEHIQDPVEMLEKAHSYLNDDGFIYIELPDGEIASEQESFLREEFFIDHIHIFSAASMTILIKKSGFKLISMERLQEPSTKYTLRAFIKK